VTGGSAQAAGGTFVKLTVPLANPFGPPNSVGDDNFQSPNLFGFDEDQNILLTAPLTVDVGASPIPAGTTVASTYIFFDPGPAEQVIGTVNFDSDVLAVITSTPTLAASDFLANTGVNYLNPGNRGLEAGDSVTISRPRQILFDTFASSPGDYVRVLTEFSPAAAGTVPEPRSLMLFGSGLVSMGLFLRRKRLGRTPSTTESTGS
jgi:PEP-CTERM motif